MNALSRQDELKRAAAEAALGELIDGTVVGVGTGSTVNHFIDALAGRRQRYLGALSSSRQSSRRLEQYGIPVLSLDEVIERGLPVPVYVDGADEINPRLQMIKGGGGALTQEKIVAAQADRFVCVADESKLVERLGRFPLPVEVIASAALQVSRRFARMGGQAVLRAGFITDNGHPILDVSGLSIAQPQALEDEVNGWPGVVTVGLFARRGADLALIAASTGIRRLSV